MEGLAWLQPEGMALWAGVLLVFSSGLTSFIAAAFGLGGGIVLLAIMGSLMPVATMIPVHGVVQLGSNAGRMLVMLKSIKTGIILPFLLGSLIGGSIGGAAVIRMPPEILQIGLGCFVLWSIWGRPPAIQPGRFAMAATGLVSTCLTMFFGATGVFVATMVKTLKFDRLAFVATHATCMTIQHGIKVVAFGLLGFAYGHYAPLMIMMIGSGLLGTLAGRYVLERTADERFHLILNALLTILALRLLWQGASAVIDVGCRMGLRARFRSYRVISSCCSRGQARKRAKSDAAHRLRPMTTPEPAARRPFGCPCPWRLRRPMALAMRRIAARQAPRIHSRTRP